jgi:hypothetical protein
MAAPSLGRDFIHDRGALHAIQFGPCVNLADARYRRRRLVVLGRGGPTQMPSVAPVIRTTFSASSRMVNSSGLPKLTGPVKSAGLSSTDARRAVVSGLASLKEAFAHTKSILSSRNRMAS